MADLGFSDLLLGFLLLITPVVYFHELGHYWVARKRVWWSRCSLSVLALNCSAGPPKVAQDGGYL